MKLNFVFILLFLGGCASAIVFSSRAEELYYNKCSACHRLYSKKEFSKDKWEKEIERMSKRARLNEDEKKIIADFLLGLENKPAKEN